MLNLLVCYYTAGCGEHLMKTLLAKQCGDLLQTECCAEQAIIDLFKEKFIGTRLLVFVSSNWFCVKLFQCKQGLATAAAHAFVNFCTSYQSCKFKFSEWNCKKVVYGILQDMIGKCKWNRQKKTLRFDYMYCEWKLQITYFSSVYLRLSLINPWLYYCLYLFLDRFRVTRGLYRKVCWYYISENVEKGGEKHRHW